MEYLFVMSGYFLNFINIYKRNNTLKCSDLIEVSSVFGEYC